MTSSLRKIVEEIQDELTDGLSGKTVCLEIKLLNPTEEHTDLTQDLIWPLSENLLQITPAEGIVHIYGFVPIETANNIVDHLNNFIDKLNGRLAKNEDDGWLSKYMEDESLHIESISLRPEFYNKDDVLAEFQSIKQTSEQYHADEIAHNDKLEKMSHLTRDDVLDKNINSLKQSLAIELDVEEVKRFILSELSLTMDKMDFPDYLPLAMLNKELKAIELRHGEPDNFYNRDDFTVIHDYATQRLRRTVFNALQFSTYDKYRNEAGDAHDKIYLNEVYNISENVVKFIQIKHMSQLKEAIYTDSEKALDKPWSTRLKELIYQTRVDLDEHTSPKLTKTNQAKVNPSL